MENPSHTALELHDSTLAAIDLHDGDITLALTPAIVHRSEARPGLDAGSVHTQSVTLTLRAATLDHHPATLPVWISDGSLEENSRRHSNTLPFPASFTGGIIFHLVLASGETLHLHAQSLAIQPQNEPIFLEYFHP